MNKVESAYAILESLEEFHEYLGAYLDGQGHDPLDGSMALNELDFYQMPKHVEAAYVQAGILMDAAADHFSSFIRLLEEPAHTIAPWTCVRGVVEASAISAWIFDTDVDVKTRVGRSFAFRYEGLRQQMKFANSIGDQKLVADIKNRIRKIESDAFQLGYSAVRNKKEKRDGIAERFPAITELVKTVLDMESQYRIQSGMAHAHPPMLQQLGFKTVEQDGEKTLHKFVTPFLILVLCRDAYMAFYLPILRKSQLFGFDMEQLKKIHRKAQIAIEEHGREILK